MSGPPLSYTNQVYPLGQPGILETDEWILWNSAAPLTIQFVNGLGIGSLWFPSPLGAMSFYAGPVVVGSPFYTTEGLVPELVPVPNGAPVVTISGPGSSFWVYASTTAFPPFAASAAPIVDIGVVTPITNAGTLSAPIIGLITPLPIVFGGSGSAAPAILAGTNITVSGSWPNQTINAVLGAGGVQTVSVNAPLVQTGGAQNPVISLDIPLPLADGGTDSTNPYLEIDNTGLTLQGSGSPVSPGTQDQTFQWELGLGGFITDNAGTPVTGGPAQLTATGGITVTQGVGGGKKINLNTTALVPVATGITSTDSTVTVTPHVGSQSVDLSVQTSGIIPAYEISVGLVNPHIVYSRNGSFTITYSAGSPPAFTLESVSRTGGGFTVTGYASTGSLGSTTVTFPGGHGFTGANTYCILYDVQGVAGGNITFDIFCIGT